MWHILYAYIHIYIASYTINTLIKDFFFLWLFPTTFSKSVLEKKIFTLFEEIFTSFIYFKDKT